MDEPVLVCHLDRPRSNPFLPELRRQVTGRKRSRRILNGPRVGRAPRVSGSIRVSQPGRTLRTRCGIPSRTTTSSRPPCPAPPRQAPKLPARGAARLPAALAARASVEWLMVGDDGRTLVTIDDLLRRPAWMARA